MKTRQVWDPRSVISHCWLSSIVHTVSCIVHSPHYTALPWDTLHYTLATQPFNGRLINPAYRWNKTTLSQLQRLQEGTKNMYFQPKKSCSEKCTFNSTALQPVPFPIQAICLAIQQPQTLLSHWYTSVETSHIWVLPFINIDKHGKHLKHWHALMETSHIWNLNAASGIFSGENKIYSANKYSMHCNFNTCKTFKILTTNSIRIFRMVTDVGKIWYSLGDWIALRCTLYEYMDVSRAMNVSHSALSDQKLTSFICTFSWNNLI